MSNDDLISGISYGTFKVWDLNKKSIKYIFNSNKSSVDSIRALKNDYLAMSSKEQIFIMNLSDSTDTPTAVLVGHSHKIDCLIQMKNGYLVSGSYKEMIVWDLTNYSIVKNITISENSLLCPAALLPNGLIVTSSKNISIWSTTGNWNSIKKIDLKNLKFLYSVVSLSESEFAISVNFNVIVYNFNDETIKFNLTGHTNVIFNILLLSNKNLASCSADQTIKIWNLSDGSLKKTLIGHTAFIYSLGKLSNGDLVSCSADKSIIIWKRSFIEE